MGTPLLKEVLQNWKHYELEMISMCPQGPPPRLRRPRLFCLLIELVLEYLAASSTS